MPAIETNVFFSNQGSDTQSDGTNSSGEEQRMSPDKVRSNPPSPPTPSNAELSDSKGKPYLKIYLFSTLFLIEDIFSLLKSCNCEFVSCRVADNFFH